MLGLGVAAVDDGEPAYFAARRGHEPVIIPPCKGEVLFGSSLDLEIKYYSITMLSTRQTFTPPPELCSAGTTILLSKSWLK